MPYIEEEARLRFEEAHLPIATTAGELNFVITDMVDSFLIADERGPNYQRINEAIGVLECAKLELYRRIAVPYEKAKRKENGDVYYSAPGPGCLWERG